MESRELFLNKILIFFDGKSDGMVVFSAENGIIQYGLSPFNNIPNK
jgi:hypothetical protein